MAADSAEISGSLFSMCVFPKILRLQDGTLAGMSGFTADCWLAMEWLREGRPEKQPAFLSDAEGDNSLDILLLKPDGTLWRNSKGVSGFVPEGKISVIGSQSACIVAETAMRLGRSAEEAVQLACNMVVNIRGPVQVEHLHPALSEAAE